MTLGAFEGDQHVEVARAFLAQGDERLVLGRLVPAVKRRRVRKLDDDHALDGGMETLFDCKLFNVDEAKVRDLLVHPCAAIGLANGLPLYTCNPGDFDGIDGLEIVEVKP